MRNARVHKLIRWCAVCSLLVIAGCGRDAPPGPQVYKVVGTVSFDDGTPLANGTIQFTPTDGKSNPASAEITDGKYETEATAGAKSVAVSQLKVTGTETIVVPTAEPGQGPTVEIKEEQVSREFNEMSKVTFEVKPVDENTFDLKVKRADPNQKPLSQPF